MRLTGTPTWKAPSGGNTQPLSRECVLTSTLHEPFGILCNSRLLSVCLTFCYFRELSGHQANKDV